MIRIITARYIRLPISTFLGFTVIELIIATTVIGLLLIPVSTVMLQFYGQALANSRNTSLAMESHEVLAAIGESLRLSSAVLASNTISDPHDPVSGWQGSSTGQVLVIATPAFNKMSEMVLNTSNGKYFQDEMVFYISGKELRRRYLANLSVTNNRQTTSCPPENSTPTCPSDLILARNILNLRYTLYDTGGNETTVPGNTRSIKVSTELTSKAYGQEISYKDTALVSLRNFQ